MKINQVKQFVASNILRFEKNNEAVTHAREHVYNLYDKNNAYCGEYQFKVLSGSFYRVQKTLSSTRIMSNKLKPLIQEFVHIHKEYGKLKNKISDSLTKRLPSEITTTTTILDYENDKFQTIRTVRKLQGELLKGKPQYTKNIEYVKEGSISERNNDIKALKSIYDRTKSINQVPYKFWA